MSQARADAIDWDQPDTIRVADFAVTQRVSSRWSDVDVYGHVNNAVYYLYVDTAVNGWLMRATGRDIRRGAVIGVVAETSCRYLAELDYPGEVTLGLALERQGRTSVVYRLAIFGPARDGEPDGDRHPVAVARFVHVYIDAETRRPVPIPAEVLAVLTRLG